MNNVFKSVLFALVALAGSPVFAQYGGYYQPRYNSYAPVPNFGTQHYRRDAYYPQQPYQQVAPQGLNPKIVAEQLRRHEQVSPRPCGYESKGMTILASAAVGAVAGQLLTDSRRGAQAGAGIGVISGAGHAVMSCEEWKGRREELRAMLAVAQTEHDANNSCQGVTTSHNGVVSNEEVCRYQRANYTPQQATPQWTGAVNVPAPPPNMSQQNRFEKWQ